MIISYISPPPQMGMELLTTHYTNYFSKGKHNTEMKLY